MAINKNMDFGVKALIIKDDKFLIMHKNGVKEDLWELPGGRMEFGETAEETVKREIMEETSLVVKPLRLLDTWNLMLRKDYQVTGIIYLCKIEEGEVKLSEEHDAFKWINASEESLDLLYSNFRNRMINWDWDYILRQMNWIKNQQYVKINT